MRKDIAKKVLKGILYLQALLWIVLGIVTGVRGGLDTLLSTIMLLLMLMNALAFFFFAYLFERSSRLNKAALLLFLLLNFVLTITDQMGIYDYTVLVLNAAALILFLVHLFPKRNQAKD